jgi:putative transposase
MHEIVAIRTRCGYRPVYIMLRREGWRLSRNFACRLYREEGLALRAQRPRRRKMAAHREARCQPSRPNQAWRMDFMADQHGDGGKIRFLTVIDVFTREALAIEAGERLRGEDVAAVLNRLVRQRGAPSAMFVDNGAGFTGQIVDLWACHHKVRMDVSQPGTPTDDAHIESFNGSFRDECLNLNGFASIAAAKRHAEAWRRDDNESRPRMALNGLSPAEFARQQRTCDKK